MHVASFFLDLDGRVSGARHHYERTMDFGRTRDKRTTFPREAHFDNECLYVITLQQFGKALLSRTVQQDAQISFGMG